MTKKIENVPLPGQKKPEFKKKNNEKTSYNSSANMAPVIKKISKRKPKREKRRRGCIIATVVDESMELFLDAQEKVMRRVASQNNVYVVEVYKVEGDFFKKKKYIEEIKELIEINELEVVLVQSRYRLSTNICDILDFEIFVAEHGAEIIYL